MTKKPTAPIQPDYAKMVVMEFSEDEVPSFSQGLQGMDLLEVVTAERCNAMMAEIVRCHKLLNAHGIEESTPKPDSWVHELNAWVDSDVEDNGNGTFTAGISSGEWGHQIQAHGSTEEEAVQLVTAIYNALTYPTIRVQ